MLGNPLSAYVSYESKSFGFDFAVLHDCTLE